MKYVVLMAVALLSIPVAAWLFKDNSRRRFGLAVLAFLSFAGTFLPVWDVALISWPTWPGYTKGIIINLLDLLAISILLTVPARRSSFPLLPPLVFYLAAIALTVFQTPNAMPTFFYLWQILKMIVLFLALRRVLQDPDDPVYLFRGFATGIVVEALVAIYQRVALGDFQADGTFVHQNTLGFSLHFFIYPAILLVLDRRNDPLLLAGLFSSIIVAILTGSRATMGIVVAVSIVTLALSVYHRTGRSKFRLILLIAAGFIVAAPIAVSQIERRLDAMGQDSDYDERQAFIATAALMLKDHPFGVGANNYVIVANIRGYMDRGGVTAFGASRATIVHNIYWMTLAEAGYLGFAALIVLLFRPIWLGLRTLRSGRGDIRGLMGGGAALTFAAVAGHAYFEWILATETIQLFLITVMAVLSHAVVGQLGMRSLHNDTTLKVKFADSPGTRRQ